MSKKSPAKMPMKMSSASKKQMPMDKRMPMDQKGMHMTPEQMASMMKSGKKKSC